MFLIKTALDLPILHYLFQDILIGNIFLFFIILWLIWLSNSLLSPFQRVICFMRFKYFVILTKYLFIILALSSSLFLFSSIKVIFEELDSLLVKNGWSLFQNSFLSEICLMFKLLVNGFFYFSWNVQATIASTLTIAPISITLFSIKSVF